MIGPDTRSANKNQQLSQYRKSPLTSKCEFYLNSIKIKISMEFLMDPNRLILKFIWKNIQDHFEEQWWLQIYICPLYYQNTLIKQQELQQWEGTHGLFSQVSV